MPPYEHYDACPGCLGTNIHSAKQCDLCGNWVTGDYIQTSEGQIICDDCYTFHNVEED